MSKQKLEQLVRQYEPVLLFGTDRQGDPETFFPLAAEHFVQECRLRRKGGFLGKGEWLDPPADKTLFSYLSEVENSKHCNLFYAAGDIPETDRLLWLFEGSDPELPADDDMFSQILAGRRLADDLAPVWDETERESSLDDPSVEFAVDRAFLASSYASKMSPQDLQHEFRKAVNATLHSVLKAAEKKYERYRDWETYPPVYHYHVCEDEKEQYQVLQYWFMYAYNDWRSRGGLNDHEGDWEVIYVFLDNKTEKPQGVAYSRHIKFDLGITEYEPLQASWSDLQDVHRVDAVKAPDVDGPFRVGEHPVVFVACGSHASYLTRGKHKVPEVPILFKTDYAMGDVLAIGPGGDQCWGNPVILNKPWNLQFEGKWGALFGNPPTGPAQKGDKWSDPVKWAEVPPFRKT